MVKFESYEDIKSLYDAGKHDIFYKKGDVKYQVSHLGSTIYCRNIEKGMGMGAINNFALEYFYAEEKPEPVVENVPETDSSVAIS